MVSCCRFLAVRSFVPEVRSWSGNDVPVNCYQTMLFSVLTRKGKVPGHSCHPPGSRPWLRGGRGQFTAPSKPVPIACPAVITEGARRPIQLALSHPKWERPGLSDCDPGRWPLLLGVTETSMGARFSTPQGLGLG